MKTSINWGKIVEQNRAKAIGVPWSAKELKAIKKGISPDDVRAGILTKKDVKSADKKEKKSGKKSLFRMTKKELVELAKKEKIKFDEDSITRPSLISELSK